MGKITIGIILYDNSKLQDIKDYFSKDTINKKYLKFKSLREKFKSEYENELKTIYQYKKCGKKIELKKRKIHYNQIYKTFDEYLKENKEWYWKDEEQDYGEYFNPNGVIKGFGYVYIYCAKIKNVNLPIYVPDYFIFNGKWLSTEENKEKWNELINSPEYGDYYITIMEGQK